MSRDIATIKSAGETGTVDGATILELKERLSIIDGRVRILSDDNKRNQSTLTKMNEVMENQMGLQNDVNLTTAEEIHPIFVVFTDLERVDREEMENMPQVQVSKAGEPSANPEDEGSNGKSEDKITQ